MKYTTEVIKMKNVDGKLIDINIYHLVLDDLSNIKTVIEEEISDIWDPSTKYSLCCVQKAIYNVISKKTDSQKHGLCAEFFMHLFLRNLGYSQKCLFSNLEENSMKKGFDGFYEFSNEFWIAESKCTIKDNKHKKKIEEALNDIDKKVNTTTGNNPWQNAVHHIAIREQGQPKSSLQTKISELANDYINNISHDSSEFNLIPVSTIFLSSNQSDLELKKDIEKVISSRKIKNMIILCTNNEVYDDFISYLKGE